MMRLIAFVLGLGLAAGPALSQTAEPLRLPFPYIFSGPLIEYGERVWNHALIPAVEEINRKGGIKGRKLEFYKVDTRFPDTAQWVAEFRRLCADPAVPVIYGVGATKSTLAIYEDTNKCGITVFNPSSAGQWPHADFGRWTFRYQPTASNVYPIMFARVKELFGTKTAIVSYTIDDEYAVNNVKVVRQALGSLGINVLGETSFKSKESNFASHVATIRAANPDAIVLNHQAGDAGTFLLQLRERGIKAQVVSDTVVVNEDFWRLSKGEGKGSIGYGIYAADDPRPIVQEWVATWRKLTGRANESPDNIVTAYYDTIKILAHVLNDAKDLSREAVREAFLRLKDFETISGPVTWPAVGDPVRTRPVMVQIDENGAPRFWPKRSS
ncbi:MAG: ABC transporter substrate-binding protein [Alphaproteobacteria bacterium]|nr:ABC transporter substrate-binding protein [Alphaproteobacteria bacterium]